MSVLEPRPNIHSLKLCALEMAQHLPRGREDAMAAIEQLQDLCSHFLYVDAVPPEGGAGSAGAG